MPPLNVIIGQLLAPEIQIARRVNPVNCFNFGAVAVGYSCQCKTLGELTSIYKIYNLIIAFCKQNLSARA